ncbi:MAG: hypothetical protein QXR81_05100 [Candidatus Nezhaarchaeales archaeon]
MVEEQIGYYLDLSCRAASLKYSFSFMPLLAFIQIVKTWTKKVSQIRTLNA